MTQSRKACFIVLLLASSVAQAAGPRFPLYESGTEDIVDYDKYGYFTNEGLPNFQYVITNRDGLAEASGSGVDPNSSIPDDPAYKKALAAGKLDDDWWSHVQTPNPQIDLFIWYEAGDDPGVRQFYMGKILERSGHYVQALKAYRACMVLYPDSAAWSASGEFSWSIAEGAWNQILNLTRKHPEVGMQLIGANVTSRTLANGLTVSVTPGLFVPVGRELASRPDLQDAARVKPDLDVGVQVEANVKPQADAGVQVEANVKPKADAGVQGEANVRPETELSPDVLAEVQPEMVDPYEIVATRGTGTVQLVKYASGDWQMLVQGKPYFVNAVVYDPTKVGVVPWEWDWMWADDNTNGVVDIEEVWMDHNKNNNRAVEGTIVGDLSLLAEMGCNTIKT